MRVGYLLGHATIVRELAGLRLPFSVNTAAQHLAVRALTHESQTTRAITRTVQHRKQLQDVLRAAGMTVLPSEANFVLVLTGDSERLVRHLAGHGIAVRPGADLGIADAVRVAVPSASGLHRLRVALDQWEPAPPEHGKVRP
jgi:histidinol-phosphate aminotransferase